MSSRNVMHGGKLYYAYSFHLTRDRALDALDDYYCEGIICESEAPDVVKMKRNNRVLYAVIFPDY